MDNIFVDLLYFSSIALCILAIIISLFGLIDIGLVFIGIAVIFRWSGERLENYVHEKFIAELKAQGQETDIDKIYERAMRGEK